LTFTLSREFFIPLEIEFGQSEVNVKYDFNVLTRRAGTLLELDRPEDAMSIYLYMADGDPSSEGGWLAERIGWCCELMGNLHGAKWWYGRTVEENPSIEVYVQARKRLNDVTIDDLLE
jgi:hypothetical protein